MWIRIASQLVLILMIGWSSAFYLDSKMCSASDFGTIYGGSEYTIESSTFGMDSTYSTL